MMKILTFLGIGPYEKTTYCWHNFRYSTDLFPEALALWFQSDIDEMIVLMTDEVRNSRPWEKLQYRLKDKVRVVPKCIPSIHGQEEEPWKIFEVVTTCLCEGDELILDITHAFRSIPILVLPAVSFLRTAESVNIKHLLYGAYDARDQATGQAPVFDLSHFLDLLEWIMASDKFMKTGNARELADLIEVAHNLPWRSKSQHNDALPHRLRGLSTSLRNLSQALALTRSKEVAQEAKKLQQNLRLAEGEAGIWAKPFSVLLDRTRAEYALFQSDSLESTRQLVHWYVDHDYAVQAVTLAREWVISWACYQLGQDPISGRQPVEEAINYEDYRRRQEAIGSEPRLLSALRNLKSIEHLMQVWNYLGDFRNDIAHCGYRSNPRKVSSILKSLTKLSDHLNNLPIIEIP